MRRRGHGFSAHQVVSVFWRALGDTAAAIYFVTRTQRQIFGIDRKFPWSNPRRCTNPRSSDSGAKPTDSRGEVRSQRYRFGRTPRAAPADSERRTPKLRNSFCDGRSPILLASESGAFATESDLSSFGVRRRDATRGRTLTSRRTDSIFKVRRSRPGKGRSPTARVGAPARIGPRNLPTVAAAVSTRQHHLG